MSYTRPAAYTLLAKVTGALVTVANATAAVWVLGADQAGTFFFCLSIVMLCMALCRLGTDNVILQACAEDGEGGDPWSAVVLFCSLIAVVGGSIAAVLWVKYSSPAYARCGYVLIPMVVLGNLSTFISLKLHARSAVCEAVMIRSVFVPLVSVICLTLWSFCGDVGFLGACFVYLLSAVVNIRIGLQFLHFKTKKPPFSLPVKSIQAVKPLLLTSLPLLVLSINDYVLQWYGPFVLGFVHRYDEVASYVLYQRLAAGIGLLATSGVMVVAPGIYAERRSGRRASGLARTALLWILGMSLPVVAGVYVLGRLYVTFMTGSDDGAVMFLLLCIAQVLIATVTLLSHAVIAEGETKWLGRATSVSVVVLVTLGYCLSSLCGGVGVAIAVLSAVSGLFVAMWVRVTWRYRCDYSGEWCV